MEKEKKAYLTAETEIITFGPTDVIATSNGVEGPGESLSTNDNEFVLFE